MKATTLRNGFVSCAVALALVGILGAITPAFATGGGCGNLCRAQITFAGVTTPIPVTVGANGVGAINNFILRSGNIAVATVNATFNPDPSLVVAVGFVNPTTVTLPFSMDFFLPLVPPLSGTITASSSIGYTLSDGDANGVTLSPVVPITNATHVLVANDFLTVGPPPTGPTNKNVDVGPFFTDPLGGIAAGGILGPNSCTAFANGTSTCTPFTANGTFSGGPFVLMVATIATGLSGLDGVGFSGVITQTQAVVPEPGTLLLAGSGILGLIGCWRRYSLRA